MQEHKSRQVFPKSRATSFSKMADEPITELLLLGKATNGMGVHIEEQSNGTLRMTVSLKPETFRAVLNHPQVRRVSPQSEEFDDFPDVAMLYSVERDQGEVWVTHFSEDEVMGYSHISQKHLYEVLSTLDQMFTVVGQSLVERTPPAASFVAITRMVNGEAQLLVEVDSPAHRGLYHAIGGKSNPGESSHETANRELMEEVEIVGGWATLYDSHLLGTLHHPSRLQGVPIGPRSYYLYPEEVREVRSKGVKVEWVPLNSLSAINSTTALRQLVYLFRENGVLNDHVFTKESLQRLHLIQEKSLSLSAYHAKSSRQWADAVEGVEVRVFFNWMHEWDLGFAIVFGSDRDEARGERATAAVINRLARALDGAASQVVRRILNQKTPLTSGMAELARLIQDTQDKVGPFLTNRNGLRMKYNGLTGFEFRGLGLTGNVGRGEVRHRSFDPKEVPFGVAEGLEVLLEAIGLEELYW